MTKEKEIQEKATEIAKKAGLFGLGVIALTQEKIEEFTQELITKGDLNKEEGKKFVREVLEEKNRQIRETVDSINQKVKDSMQEQEERQPLTKKDIEHLASKGDIEDIKERLDTLTEIEQLKKKLAELERRVDE